MKSQDQERELARIKALREKHSKLTGDAPPHNHTIREIIDAAYLIESVQTDLTESIEEGHTHDGSDSAKVDWGDIDSRPSVFPPDTHSHPTSEVTSLQEYIEDTTGAMVAGNTETGIAITYDDSSGKLNAAVAYGTGANTACQGNDARLSDARTPLEHEHELADITDYVEPEQGLRPSDLFGVGKEGYVIDPWELTANKGAASGYASLDGSSLVVQNPANAQTIAAASKIPISNASGKIDDAWIEPAGSTTQVQYNDAGALAGDANFTWDKTNKTLTVKGSASESTLGSELLTNPSFDADSDWTKGAGWSISGGQAVHTAGNTEALSQNIAITSGAVYRINITISGRTAGTITAALGSATFTISSGTTQISSTRTSSLIATGSTGAQTFSITPTTDWDGEIDSCSVKLMTANAAPILNIQDYQGAACVPFRGRDVNATVYIGPLCGQYSYGGTSNLGIGKGTFTNLTEASNCLSIGAYSQRYNQAGNSNTGIGGYSLQNNIYGSDNVAIGYQSMNLGTSPNFGVSIGTQAQYSNLTGAGVVTIGYQSGYNVTGGKSVFIGYQVGYSSYPTGYSASSSNILMIHNANSATPLIFGDFSTGLVTIHNDLKANTKFGLGLAPIARRAHVADPSGGATVDTEARTAINAILATIEAFGFHATS